jgi:hypothetical protein
MADEVAAPAVVATPAPVEPAKELTPAAVIDPKQELEAMLKKMGGLEVNAGGKKHKVDSVEKLIRYAQRGLPVESSLEEIGRQRAELEPVAQLLQQLQNGSEDEAEAALEKLIDSKLEKAQQEIEKKQQAAQEAQQVASVKSHISGGIVKALELLDFKVAGDPNAPDDANARKLEPIAVEFMKPIIRAMLNAGRPLDPEVLAEKVRPMLDQLFEYQTRGLEGEALLKRLGPDVGKRMRAALLAQLNGGGAKAAPKASEAPSEPKSIWDPRKMF